jgi:hypothetical protein
MDRVNTVLVYLQLTSITRLFTPDNSLLIRRVIIYMIKCLLQYKLYFQEVGCHAEIKQTEVSLSRLRTHKENHLMYDILMTNTYVPVCDKTEMEYPIDNRFKRRACKKPISGRVYNIYRYLAPYLDFYYFIVPESPVANCLNVQGYSAKYISGWELYNLFRKVIISEKLFLGCNRCIIRCIPILKTITGVKLCHEIELFSIVFSMVYKIPDVSQKMCNTVFRREKRKEKQQALHDFNSGSKLKKQTQITPEIWNNPWIVYKISPGLLSCFATLDIYESKDYYTADEIKQMSTKYITTNSTLFLNKTKNIRIAVIAGTKLNDVFGVTMFHRRQFLPLILEELTVLNASKYIC